MSNHITPRIDPHIWARGTTNEIPGAVVFIGKRNLFIAHDEIPDMIARLQAIHALNA
ncbi:hypothetical protein ACFWQK_09030 [Brachybacterium paraconglomeratum]